MLAQVISRFEALDGTIQQAALIARALASIGLGTRLISLGPRDALQLKTHLGAEEVELLTTAPDSLPAATWSIVVGLWEQTTLEAAERLSRSGERLVLVPTTYWQKNLLSFIRRPAAALWYQSWDQAMEARAFWNLAGDVAVVPCAVDVQRFRPVEREHLGKPWVLCRHSRDAAEKFPVDRSAITTLVDRLRLGHDVVFELLGASHAMRGLEHAAIHAHPQESEDAASFLRRGNLWVYDHADYWRETACLGLLEAMASGLPVVVRAAGGMRESLIHGVTGFACSSTEEFFNYTSLLLARPDLYAAMASAARRFVVRNRSVSSLRLLLAKHLDFGT